MKDYSANLDQASRLALCPVSEFVTIREDEESEETAHLNNHPLSARSCGFVMPSRARTGVVFILPHLPHREDNDEGEAFDDDDENNENILVDEKEKESFEDYKTELLSERGINRAALRAELSLMGMEWED